jgi:hypothetical protein
MALPILTVTFSRDQTSLHPPISDDIRISVLPAMPLMRTVFSPSEQLYFQLYEGETYVESRPRVLGIRWAEVLTSYLRVETSLDLEVMNPVSLGTIDLEFFEDSSPPDSYVDEVVLRGMRVLTWRSDEASRELSESPVGNDLPRAFGLSIYGKKGS